MAVLLGTVQNASVRYRFPATDDSPLDDLTYQVERCADNGKLSRWVGTVPELAGCLDVSVYASSKQRALVELRENVEFYLTFLSPDCAEA